MCGLFDRSHAFAGEARLKGGAVGLRGSAAECFD